MTRPAHIPNSATRIDPVTGGRIVFKASVAAQYEPTPAALPHLGLCPTCEASVKVRVNGSLYKHGCPGDGTKPAALLAPTFARWLHAQSKRSDDWTNPLTCFAQDVFTSCVQVHPDERWWSTPSELHEQMHAVGGHCTAACRELHRAAELYEKLRGA